MFLEINGIKKSFGTGDSRVNVLKGIDLEVEKGTFCVLLGPSGSGKSTLLNIIGGIDRADEGYISIGGERTADMKEKQLTSYRRRHHKRRAITSLHADAGSDHACRRTYRKYPRLHMV